MSRQQGKDDRKGQEYLMTQVVDGNNASGVLVDAMRPELAGKVYRNESCLPVVGDEGDVCAIERAVQGQLQRGL